MIYPDYDNSIVNLMSSILNSFGASSIYPELSLLKSKELIPKKNVILLVVDGLGYEFLKNEYQDGLLQTGLRGKMTSVFPSTTATAITTFLTGTAPQQHGITGWNILLKELGVIATILPFTSRMGVSLSSPHDVGKRIFKYPSVFEQIKSQSYYILPKKLANSVYTLAHAGESKKIGVNGLSDLFQAIVRSAKENTRKKYIYAYWHQYDHIAHSNGYNSVSAKQHVDQIRGYMQSLTQQLKDTSSILMVTADHGFTNTSKEHTIELKEHPELVACLTLPLCGESRASYCYVKNNKRDFFLSYIKKNLSQCMEVYPSEELFEKGLFGRGKPSESLLDRIGDYILLMKENYIIKDFLITEEEHFYDGRHGGCSENEMQVPLMVFDFNEKETTEK